MLKPDDRSHLFELLKPPIGFQLESAVGTTFSLDLISLLTLPCSFALFDWEQEDGRPVADPLALLEALRRYGDRMTIFCQSGQIRIPEGKYQPILTYLESSIVQVLPRKKNGIFHPKVWVLKFSSEEEPTRYRVLCLSRNLTFDRCWDSAVVLDGELRERQNAIRKNNPLADFVGELASHLRGGSADRRQQIRDMAQDLRTVAFELPENFDDYAFWPGGLSAGTPDPFAGGFDNSVVISPFLSGAVLERFPHKRGSSCLVSRVESLEELPKEALARFEKVFHLAPEVETEEAPDEKAAGSHEVLNGLHAKLYILDRGWNASVFSGSFNATTSAFEQNIEFMVELIGRKKKVGTASFLEDVKGQTKFVNLLQEFHPSEDAVGVDPTQKELDHVLFMARTALAKAGPRLMIQPTGNDLYVMELSFERRLIFPESICRVLCRPLTVHANAARELDGQNAIPFPNIPGEGITPFIAFSCTAEIAGQTRDSDFLLNLPMEGAPADRKERVLTALLEDKEKLMRFILFILAAEDEAGMGGGDLAKFLYSENDAEGGRGGMPALFETILRALHADPRQFDRVASLIDDLRKTSKGTTLLSDDFQKFWDVVWKTCQKCPKQS